MHSLAFLLAAVLYIALTVFIFFSYPRKWRENSIFVALLVLWHIIGLMSVVTIFTVFKDIQYENIRHEISRIGTCYYIMTTLQAILFLFRAISRRAFLLASKLGTTPLEKPNVRWITDKNIHAIIITTLSFCIFVVGYFNIDFLKSTRYEVQIPSDSVNEELTICLIADIHAGSGTWEYTYDDLEDLINDSDADVLLIAGDVFDETTSDADIDRVCEFLRAIDQPRYGTYLIYGNHDASLDSGALDRLSETGITVLDDEMTIIGEDIQLIGWTDPVFDSMSLEDLMKTCSPDPDDPVIILTHRPRYFQQMSDLGCDLVMAGHTHGFNIPQFLGTTLLGDMYSGLREYGSMTAVTTSGVSAWGYHYKWPAQSEVVTIHVTFTGGEQG